MRPEVRLIIRYKFFNSDFDMTNRISNIFLAFTNQLADHNFFDYARRLLYNSFFCSFAKLEGAIFEIS